MTKKSNPKWKMGSPQNGKNSRYRLWIGFKDGKKDPKEKKVYYSDDRKTVKSRIDISLGLRKLKKLFQKKAYRVSQGRLYDNEHGTQADPIEVWTEASGWLTFNQHQQIFNNKNIQPKPEGHKPFFKLWILVKFPERLKRQREKLPPCPVILSTDQLPGEDVYSRGLAIEYFRVTVLGSQFRNKYDYARIYTNDPDNRIVGTFDAEGKFTCTCDKLRAQLLEEGIHV